MCKAHAKVLQKPAGESSDNVSYLQRKCCLEELEEKAERIQHPKLPAKEKFVVHVVSAHLSAATKLHRCAKCRVSRHIKVQRPADHALCQKLHLQKVHNLGRAKCCQTAQGTKSHVGDCVTR